MFDITVKLCSKPRSLVSFYRYTWIFYAKITVNHQIRINWCDCCFFIKPFLNIFENWPLTGSDHFIVNLIISPSLNLLKLNGHLSDFFLAMSRYCATKYLNHCKMIQKEYFRSKLPIFIWLGARPRAGSMHRFNYRELWSFSNFISLKLHVYHSVTHLNDKSNICIQ